MQFLDVIQRFQEQRIDTPSLIMSVTTLFRGYDSLLEGFSSFIPGGQGTSLTAYPPSFPPPPPSLVSILE